MRRWLQDQGAPQTKRGRRKLRLFACACCRRIAAWQEGEANRKAMEVAELFADGKVTKSELAAVRPRDTICIREATAATRDVAWDGAWYASWDAAKAAAGMSPCAGPALASLPGMAAQCAVLRDLLGNPFRQPVL